MLLVRTGFSAASARTLSATVSAGSRRSTLSLAFRSWMSWRISAPNCECARSTACRHLCRCLFHITQIDVVGLHNAIEALCQVGCSLGISHTACASENPGRTTCHSAMALNPPAVVPPMIPSPIAWRGLICSPVSSGGRTCLFDQALCAFRDVFPHGFVQHGRACAASDTKCVQRA